MTLEIGSYSMADYGAVADYEVYPGAGGNHVSGPSWGGPLPLMPSGLADAMIYPGAGGTHVSGPSWGGPIPLMPSGLAGWEQEWAPPPTVFPRAAFSAGVAAAVGGAAGALLDGSTEGALWGGAAGMLVGLGAAAMDVAAHAEEAGAEYGGPRVARWGGLAAFGLAAGLAAWLTTRR